jgi:hypothetical protein
MKKIATSLFALVVFSISLQLAVAAGPFEPISTTNDRTLELAGKGLGIDVTKCTPEQRHSIETAFHLIRPGDRYDNYQLNPYQAQAIIYLALKPQSPVLEALDLGETVVQLQNIASTRGNSLFLELNEKSTILDLSDAIKTAAAFEGRIEVMQIALQLKSAIIQGGKLISRAQIRKTVAEIVEHANAKSSTPNAVRGVLLLTSFAFIEAVGPMDRGYVGDSDRKKIFAAAIALRKIATTEGRKDITDLAHKTAQAMEHERRTKHTDIKEIAARIGECIRKSPLRRDSPPRK